jgi:hypothetical protein
MKIPIEKPVVLRDLYDAISRAARVVVRESPKHDAEMLFESTNQDDLDDLRQSLLLEPPAESFHCMCIGSPAVYLYERGGNFVELTNHHGLSVRCSLWTSDVRVRDTEKWLSWFDRRGLSGPRREVETMRAQEEEDQKNWDRWLAAMPKAIAAVWSDALAGNYGNVNVDPLRSALERSTQDEKDRILVLLEWFGSGAGPWSGFPFYETAAEKLLLGYPTTKIVEAIASSRITSTQVEGAARLLGGWSFQQQRPGGLKDVPDVVKSLLWDHVKGTKDTDKLSRATRAFHPTRE